MFLKLFTLQLLLLFKPTLKIAWSGALWFAFSKVRSGWLCTVSWGSARKHFSFLCNMCLDAYILIVKYILGWFH